MNRARDPGSKSVSFCYASTLSHVSVSQTWAGYDTIIYLFSYEDSKNTFNIPYDLQQFQDIFKLPGGK